MKMKIVKFFGFIVLAVSFQVSASIIDITSQANNGEACSIASVTGNNGGSTSCYGLFNGNDDVNVQYQIGSDLFSFLGKDEFGQLSLTGAGTNDGTWAFSNSLLSQSFSDYMLVIKAGNEWGAYLFSGSDNLSIDGNWKTDDFTNNGGQQPGISHMSIYATSISIPEPSVIALLGLGLLGLGFFTRRLS